MHVLFNFGREEFSVTASNHQASITKARGVRPDALEVVDSDRDQRTGTLIEIPVPPPEANLARDAFTAATGDEKIAILARRAGLT